MLRAIRMRNLLAWCEINYANEGFGILASLTPERLNRKHVSGKLWMVYTRPELERLLQPIHQASPLELAYYLRFMQFLAKEKLLSKVGSKTKEDSGFAAKWLSSLEDKRAAGSIYEGLLLKDFEQDGQAVTGLMACFPEQTSTDTTKDRPTPRCLPKEPTHAGPSSMICSIHRPTLCAAACTDSCRHHPSDVLCCSRKGSR